MAMYSICLEGDTRKLLSKIRSFSEIDKKGINAALGEAMRSSTVERFKTSRGPDGKKWTVSLRVKEGGGQTLVKSTHLRNSIKFRSDASGFAVGTNVRHAATHQFGEKGRTIKAKNRKVLRFQVGGQWISKKQVRVTIPARPFLGLSEDDLEEIRATVEDFIGEED